MALKAKTASRTQSKAKDEAIKEVLQEKIVRLNANLPESLYKQLKIKAVKDDKKINELVVEWINEYLS